MEFLFTLIQKLEIIASGHFGSSHVGKNNIVIYFLIGRNNDGARNPRFCI
jgi:hypothetical protein